MMRAILAINTRVQSDSSRHRWS